VRLQNLLVEQFRNAQIRRCAPMPLYMYSSSVFMCFTTPFSQLCLHFVLLSACPQGGSLVHTS
jgi:hypothetical protein